MRLLSFTIILLSSLYFSLSAQVNSNQNLQTQKRIALVIGNGNYSSNILSNPENDAKDMTAVLRNLGFTVLSYTNLDLSQMKKAIDDFGMKLQGYDVGLFYFAGHGIQYAGKNYLVPVDAKLAFERFIEYDCIQVDRVLAFMEEAKTGINLIILDACRNNPFEKSWSRALGEKGLASMDAPKGTLIAYATGPNKTASDGSGRNGLYTSAILESIINPGYNVIQMFQNVRAIVQRKSNQQQMPWETTSLIGDFYFNPSKTTIQTEQPVVPLVPSVNLSEISQPKISGITSSGANINTEIVNSGGGEIVLRGVCFSTLKEPTIKNSTKTDDGDGIGSFNSIVSGLEPNKTYFVRAYAINSAGTAYSPQVSFTTVPGQPVIKTEVVTKVTSSSAVATGNIYDDGGAKILLRGICWSTSPSPDINDSKTENGGGTGVYTTPVIVLLPDTVYYLRAYCDNGHGTEYGNEIVFRTLRADQVVDIDGNIYNTIKLINSVWMVENLKTTKYNDGTPIPLVIDKIAWRSQTSAAYCWYDNQEVYKETYGALYNWEVVKSNKLCPFGWHVPTDEEWTELESSGGGSYAGGYLKERGFEHWAKPNDGFESFYNRFNALPGGERDDLGEFKRIGTKGNWWTSIDPKKGISVTREIISNSFVLRKNKVESNSVGYSVRCVKDQD